MNNEDRVLDIIAFVLDLNSRLVLNEYNAINSILRYIINSQPLSGNPLVW